MLVTKGVARGATPMARRRREKGAANAGYAPGHGHDQVRASPTPFITAVAYDRGFIPLSSTAMMKLHAFSRR